MVLQGMVLLVIREVLAVERPPHCSLPHPAVCHYLGRMSAGDSAAQAGQWLLEQTGASNVSIRESCSRHQLSCLMPHYKVQWGNTRTKIEHAPPRSFGPAASCFFIFVHHLNPFLCMISQLPVTCRVHFLRLVLWREWHTSVPTVGAVTPVVPRAGFPIHGWLV